MTFNIRAKWKAIMLAAAMGMGLYPLPERQRKIAWPQEKSRPLKKRRQFTDDDLARIAAAEAKRARKAAKGRLAR